MTDAKKQKRYSVALLYMKRESGNLRLSIRNLIVYSCSKDAALGHSIRELEEDMKGYQINMYTVIEIDDKVLIDNEQFAGKAIWEEAQALIDKVENHENI